MKLLVVFIAVLSMVKESISGGVTKGITEEDLIIHGQATDILSKFSNSVLKILQNLSNNYNEIARKRDDVTFKMFTDRALDSKDELKSSTLEQIEAAHQKLIDDLANIANVSPDQVLEASDNPSYVTQSIEKVREFIQTAKLLYDSANKVVNGKGDEFVIQFMYSNQAEDVKYNLSGC